MTPEQMSQKAQELFLQGFHCSQAVLAVIAEMFEVESDAAIAAVAPFGGGIASTGNVCGTLSGAIASIGLLMGKKEPAAKDHRAMWKLGNRMVREFENITSEFGGINCSNIARVDWHDRDAVRAFYRDKNSSRHTACKKVIGETVMVLADMLADVDFDRK